jgi:hypothetical protein
MNHGDGRERVAFYEGICQAVVEDQVRNPGAVFKTLFFVFVTYKWAKLESV